MDLLTAEMEALLLESVILGQEGAIKTASEKAVSRRRREEAQAAANAGAADLDSDAPRKRTIRRSSPRRPDFPSVLASPPRDDKYVRARSQSL